jgi:hypothetical protein
MKMNMNQSAHAREDLYAEIARLKRQKNKIIKAFMASWTVGGAIIAGLLYWATNSIVIG